MENTEKVLCLTEQLNVIFKKLKGTIFNFIELSLSTEEIENANEILCGQSSRVIEVQNIVENYFETSSKSSKVCSSKVFKSKKSTSQRSSSNSSHSKSVHLKAEAELILLQTKELFERKAKLLEQQKLLELEMEKEKIFEGQERLKIAELKEHFDKMCLESNVLPPELSKQSSVEKCQSYVTSLKNASPLDHVHSKHLSQRVCSESVCSEPKSVRNFPKVLRSDSKISNDRSTSFKGHESSIDPLDTPETSGKTKLQTSSNRIDPLAERINEFIDKPVEGEETVLPINNLANLTVMNAIHQELESRQLPPN